MPSLVRLAGSQSAPAGDCPACPWQLQDDAVAVAEWDRFAPVLHASGRLSEADAPAFAIYCSAFSRSVSASELIRKEGPTVSTGQGGCKAHPVAAVVKEAEATMARILIEFGCTPLARSKTGQAAAPAEDDLAKFAKTRKAR